MTAAPCVPYEVQAPARPREWRSSWSYDLARALVFGSLLSVIFWPEFPHTSLDELSPVYNKVLGSFRYIDVVLLLAAAVHVVALFCQRRKRVSFPRRVAVPGVAFLACIGLAIAYGAHRGGSNFFFDWRGLALGISLYFVWSFWMQSAADVEAAIGVFLLYTGIRILVIYGFYLSGQRDNLLDVTIPVFDGPILSCVVFTGLLAFARLGNAGHRRYKWLLGGLAMAAYLLVLICLRRTYWGELALGTLILLLMRRRHRLRTFAIAAAAIAIAGCILGSSFSGRLRSLDVTSDDKQFSADNADHVYDLMDAWYEVRQSPVMGIGLGTSYRTWHIRNWKPDSVMVHNAPLHVWLKYGITGLVCYLWFHVALLYWLSRRVRSALVSEKAFLSAALAYLTAQFIMTLGFAPWPYSELQLTTLISFILAAAVMSGERRRAPLGREGAHALQI